MSLLPKLMTGERLTRDRVVFAGERLVRVVFAGELTTVVPLMVVLALLALLPRLADWMASCVCAEASTRARLVIVACCASAAAWAF